MDIMCNRNSSSSRTSGCTNGSPRRRATSPPRDSTTSSARRAIRPAARSTSRATRSAPTRPSRRAATANVSCACHWTVNVAASTGHGKLYADAYSVAPVRHLRAAGVRRSSTPEDLAGVPISVGYQSGSHYSTIQALEHYLPAGRDQPVVRRRHAVQPHGAADRPQDAGRVAVQRAVLLPRAARLPQDHRHHLHDGLDGHRRSRPGRRAQVLRRAAPRAARHRPAARALHPLLQERVPGALPRPDGHRPLGTGRADRVRALHRARSSRNRASGSPSAASSPTPAWVADSTKARS